MFVARCEGEVPLAIVGGWKTADDGGPTGHFVGDDAVADQALTANRVADQDVGPDGEVLADGKVCFRFAIGKRDAEARRGWSLS